MADVGQEIRRLREAKGWGQAKLAVAAGVAVSGVSQIENGRRNPNSSTLAKLADALDVEVADFFPKAQAPLPEVEQRRDEGFRSPASAYRLPGRQPDPDKRRRFAEEISEAFRGAYQPRDLRDEESEAGILMAFMFALESSAAEGQISRPVHRALQRGINEALGLAVVDETGAELERRVNG